MDLGLSDGMNDTWELFSKSITRLACNKTRKIKSAALPQFVFVKTVRTKIIPNRNADVVTMSKRDKRKFVYQNKLDLHGCTTETLFDKLQRFCEMNIQNGIRNVEIITGKGNGIMKTQTQIWLQIHSRYIISYTTKQDKYNQGGSFLVKLRKM